MEPCLVTRKGALLAPSRFVRWVLITHDEVIIVTMIQKKQLEHCSFMGLLCETTLPCVPPRRRNTAACVTGGGDRSHLPSSVTNCQRRVDLLGHLQTTVPCVKYVDRVTPTEEHVLLLSELHVSRIQTPPHDDTVISAASITSDIIVNCTHYYYISSARCCLETCLRNIGYAYHNE